MTLFAASTLAPDTRFFGTFSTGRCKKSMHLLTGLGSLYSEWILDVGKDEAGRHRFLSTSTAQSPIARLGDSRPSTSTSRLLFCGRTWPGLWTPENTGGDQRIRPEDMPSRGYGNHEEIARLGSSRPSTSSTRLISLGRSWGSLSRAERCGWAELGIFAAVPSCLSWEGAQYTRRQSDWENTGRAASCTGSDDSMMAMLHYSNVRKQLSFTVHCMTVQGACIFALDGWMNRWTAE
eukprot:s596_g19.t3